MAHANIGSQSPSDGRMGTKHNAVLRRPSVSEAMVVLREIRTLETQFLRIAQSVRLRRSPLTTEQSCIALLKRYSLRASVGVVALAVLCVEPAAAQSIGEEFCETEMAVTIKNIFTLIQFGGPLAGGTLALGAAVATPMVRQVDTKMEFKQI